jgi:hypothetical protein
MKKTSFCYRLRKTHFYGIKKEQVAIISSLSVIRANSYFTNLSLRARLLPSGAEPGGILGSFRGPFSGYFGVFWDILGYFGEGWLP